MKLQFDKQRNTLVFDRVLDLPGGHTKFVIRRDPTTGLYFTLSNNNTHPVYTDQRNVLVLCVSVDLNVWTIVKTLLEDDTGLAPADSVKYTGFHYVDWQYDGENIIYAIRTGYRGANSYHNANRITFKVLYDYRNEAQGLLSAAIEGTVLVPPFERDVHSYQAVIPINAADVDVRLGAAVPTAQFTVNGQSVKAGGTVSVLFPHGVNRTKIVIVGGDSGAVPVTIECTRAAPPAPPGLLKLTGSGFTVGEFKDGQPAWLNRACKRTCTPHRKMCFQGPL